jgi:hypothetical protein
MKINKLDRQTLATLRQEIDLALKSVCDRHGIALKLGSCRFTATAATMKLEIATIGTSGEVLDTEAVTLRANLRALGLTEAHLTQTISLDGKRFVLKGYKVSRRAKPFTLTCLDNGKIYVAREGQVRSALGLPLSRF